MKRADLHDKAINFYSKTKLSLCHVGISMLTTTECPRRNIKIILSHGIAVLYN